MANTIQFRKITKWIKLFTYISGTILLIINNPIKKLPFLIPILILILLINYSREYFLEEAKKPVRYIWLSMSVELLLIICIGLIENFNINLLFFFVFVSSTIIIYPFNYAAIQTAVYIAATFAIYSLRNNISDLMQTFVAMFINYGVAIAFVMGMSYLVKLQIREKERLAHLNAELEQAYKKVIETSAAAQKLSVEQERIRMAREIHDTLAHTLTTLIIQLEACKKLASLDPSRLPEQLEKAQELSRSGFNDIKHSIKALRPQTMEEKSFVASIQSLIHDTMEATRVKITLNNLLPQEVKLTSQLEVALFRVIQESITNSIRHGHADEIIIEISYEVGMLKLFISNNGLGCISIKKGYGMQGMQERIEGLSGNIEFASPQGRGFTTKVSIPNKAV